MKDSIINNDVKEFLRNLSSHANGSGELNWEKSNTPDTFILKMNDEIWVSISEMDDFEGSSEEPDYQLAIYNGRNNVGTFDRMGFDMEVFKEAFGDIPHLFFKRIFNDAKATALDLKGTLKKLNAFLVSGNATKGKRGS